MKKAIAIILLILFVPLFLMVTFYFSTSQTLLNAKEITNDLSKSNIYAIITDELVPQIGTMITSKENISTIDDQTKEASEILTKNIEENIDADWLKEQFETIYTKITNYLKGSNYSQEINIDLTPISESFSISNISENVLTEDFLQSQYDSMPKCSNNTTDTNCISNDITYEQFESEFKNQVENINIQNNNEEKDSFIPATINLYESFNISNENSPNFGQNMLDIGNNIIKNLNYIGYILIGVLIFIIILLVIMFSKDLYFLTKALGITLLITSILAILVATMGYFTGPTINALLPLETAGLSSIGLLIIPIINIIIGSIATKIIITGIILLIFSIILLIYSKKYKPNNTKK